MAKLKTKMTAEERLAIINQALEDVTITEEPIKHYYKMDKVLGAGKFGVVKSGHRIGDPDFKVAVKTIALKNLTSQFHSIIQEILTLKKCDHPNIVKIYEIFKDRKRLYIVMEFVEGKELFSYIVENFKMNEADTCHVVQQLLKTIKYMHSINFLHRDLKPENIMINPETKHIKLIDFGLASYYLPTKNLETKVGTPYYVAPEVLAGNYNREVDVWSIGVIWYTLLTGCPPFQGDSINKVYEKIKAAKVKFYKEDWANIAEEAKEFILSTIAKDPKKRLSAQDALNHPWIKMKHSLSTKISPDILKKLANFKAPDMLKKEMFLILANQIDKEQIQEWNQAFEELDVDGTGMIKVSTIIELCKSRGR